MEKIIILGAGLAGLAAADKLSLTNKVIILEKQNYLGGLASSFKINKRFIPRHYHHIVWHNTFTKSFLKRFNLLDSCEWKKINVAIGLNGKLYNINKIFGLLKFNYLSLIGKIRFALFGLYVTFLMNPSKIDGALDTESWLKKYAGKEVKDKIFYNLYARNKFNLSLKRISAKQFAHRLKEKEFYDKFTYPKKGLQLMIDGLKKDIQNNKGKIIKNCKIEKIDLNKKTIYLKNKKKISFDILINTIPIPEFIKLTEGLPKDYSKKLSKLKYTPCVELVFETEELLDKNNYWVNLFQERIHNIMQNGILSGNKINWCIRYGGSEEDLDLKDKRIKELYMDVVKKYFPNSKIKWIKVFKEKYAEPTYDKDYINYKPNYRTPINYLYMAGIQVSFPKIRNMNSALESGIKVAELIEKDWS